MTVFYGTFKETVFEILQNGIPADETGYVNAYATAEDALTCLASNCSNVGRTAALIPIEVEEDQVDYSIEYPTLFHSVLRVGHAGAVSKEEIAARTLDDIQLYKLYK